MKNNVKVIKNQGDYEEALQFLGELMDKDPVPDSENENTLELLLLVIKDYEEKLIKPNTVDPIEAIEFRMDQMNLSRKELIPYVGSISKVSEVLSGKRTLSLAMIRRLHEGLGIPLESLVGAKKALRKTARKKMNKKPRQKSKSLIARKGKKPFLL